MLQTSPTELTSYSQWELNKEQELNVLVNTTIENNTFAQQLKFKVNVSMNLILSLSAI